MFSYLVYWHKNSESGTTFIIFPVLPMRELRQEQLGHFNMQSVSDRAGIHFSAVC